MPRALLAWIFAILAASAAMAVAPSTASAEVRGHFATIFDPAPPSHQGQDLPDIEKQPCFSAPEWHGKFAVSTYAAAVRCHSAPIAGKAPPLQPCPVKHFLFLYACAPRAPPAASGV
jgi:hypothetical protein